MKKELLKTLKDKYSDIDLKHNKNLIGIYSNKENLPNLVDIALDNIDNPICLLFRGRIDIRCFTLNFRIEQRIIFLELPDKSTIDDIFNLLKIDNKDNYYMFYFNDFNKDLRVHELMSIIHSNHVDVSYMDKLIRDKEMMIKMVESNRKRKLEKNNK